MDEWRPANVVPHLARDHGQHEEHGQHGPGVPVEEELEVVPAEVDEPADQPDEDEEGHGAGVVGRTEDSDVHVGPLVDPP